MSPVDPDRAAELLGAAGGVRVLVVGDLMLDRYVTGVVDRVSPEAPVPVVRVQAERFGVGGAANVAANVTALGASCQLVGHLGADPEGDRVIRALEEAGVGCEGIVRGSGRPTTVKTRVLARHQQIVRFDREVDCEVQGAVADEIARRVGELAPQCDIVVVQDYDKGVLSESVRDLVTGLTSATGMAWVVDPKRRSFFSYRGATVFKPNARELADALGEDVRIDDPVWLEDVRRRIGCEHLLVTLGDDGMALKSATGQHVRLPTLAQSVFDVSGAGDTVTAVVTTALAAGGEIVEAAALANHAAAVGVGKSGVQTVSATEIQAHVAAHPDW
ncbi:MAG TPA: PfkB family carbohydrate kinase [Longimicrobiales bacterium]|nr:PfkB family carbohydrate kinase [Longimicrobiales bacterium]